MASIRCAASASAFPASPSLRATTPGFLDSSSNCLTISALLTLPFGPSSHVMAAASTPFFAAPCQERRRVQCVRLEASELRRTCEGCGEIACAACSKRQIEGSEGFHPDRHACQARGFIDKGQWARALRHRHTTAGYESCGGCYFACARWQDENGGREGRAGSEGRPAGGQYR